MLTFSFCIKERMVGFWKTKLGQIFQKCNIVNEMYIPKFSQMICNKLIFNALHKMKMYIKMSLFFDLFNVFNVTASQPKA